MSVRAERREKREGERARVVSIGTSLSLSSPMLSIEGVLALAGLDELIPVPSKPPMLELEGKVAIRGFSMVLPPPIEPPPATAEAAATATVAAALYRREERGLLATFLLGLKTVAVSFAPSMSSFIIE